MDAMTSLMLEFIRLQSTALRPEDPIRLRSAGDLLQYLFASLSLGPEAQILDTALQGIATGRLSFAQGIIEAEPALVRLGTRLSHDTRLATQIHEYVIGLRPLLAARDLIHAGAHHIDLTISDPSVLRLVHEIRLIQAQQIIVLIGAVNAGIGRVPIELGDHPLLKRINIAFVHGSPYPRLTVRTPSVAETAHWTSERLDWQQLDLPEYLLELFDARTNPRGTIKTERVTVPYRVAGPSLNITLGSTIQCLRTQIADRDHVLLAEVLCLLD
jgi:hypothetical protein